MRFAENLYWGEQAARSRRKIISDLKKGKLLTDVYVVTPPSNRRNLLDIYPAAMLLVSQAKREETEILGIAVTYWEALEVVRQMVDDKGAALWLQPQ